MLIYKADSAHNLNESSTTLMKFTQFCPEGLLDGYPFGLVGWVVLLDGFHHHVHDVKQHPEICAVSQGDGWFPDSAAAGSTVTETQTAHQEAVNLKSTTDNQ